MGKRSQYVVYILNGVLGLFLVAVCTALFSLGDKVSFFQFPVLLRIFLELIFYAGILFFFYSNRTVEPDIWVRSALVFIMVRVGLALLNAVAFTIAGPSGTTFSSAFSAALFKNPVIHLLEFLTVPFFAFPFVFEYARSQAEHELEELGEFEESETELAEQIPPGQMENQIVPVKLWKQFFLTENPEEIKDLLGGVKLSSYTKALVMPAPEEPEEEVPEIARLLEDLLPPEVEQIEEVPKQQAPSPETPRSAPQKAERPPVQPQTPAEEKIPEKQLTPQAQLTDELSELDQLINLAETTGAEEQQVPEATPEPQAEPMTTAPETPPVPEVEPVEPPGEEEIPTLEPEEIPGGAREEEPEVPEIPLELPETIEPVETTEEFVPEKQPPQQAPQPSPTPSPQATPPPGGYTITSPDDFYRISLRRLIQLNQGKQGAQVLERLVKRGADFQLAIPMSMLIPQLREGKAAVTVEYVYGEIPLELVNFMSTDQSGDLSELELDLPIDEIMSQTDPKIIFGDNQPQEESQWNQGSDDLNLDTPIIPSSGNSEEENVVDLSDVENLNVESIDSGGSGFPQPLIDFAQEHGLTPILEPSSSVSIVIFCPAGTPTNEFIPSVEWLSTTELSPEWSKTPCYAFIDTETASAGILINPGGKTQRDAVVVVTGPAELTEVKSLLDQAYQTIEIGTQIEQIPLQPLEVIPVMSERDIKTEIGYSGMWVKFPGKTIAVVSGESADEENLSRIATIGSKLMELLSGSGMVFSTWQRVILHAGGWTVAMHPIQGGAMVIELKKDLQIAQITKEFQEITQQLMDIK